VGAANKKISKRKKKGIKGIDPLTKKYLSMIDSE